MTRLSSVSLESAESSFNFIKDDKLRVNLAIITKHITLLIQLDNQLEDPYDKSSNFKTILILCGSIIETLLHYKLAELNERYDKVRLYESKNDTEIVSTSEVPDTNYKIQLRRVIKKYPEINPHTNLKELIRYSKQCQLLKDDLLTSVEDVQKFRNNLHIKGIGFVDSEYNEKHIKDAFECIKSLIIQVKEFEPPLLF